MLKATAGGGGKGNESSMERRRNLEEALELCYVKNLQAAFGNDGMYMEKFIEEPRHIEIQIAGDKYW